MEMAPVALSLAGEHTRGVFRLTLKSLATRCYSLNFYVETKLWIRNTFQWEILMIACRVWHGPSRAEPGRQGELGIERRLCLVPEM